MKLLAFSVYDEKSGAYGHPFFVSAVGIASRMFSDWCNSDKTFIGKHPEDYKLYQIGAWLDDCAKFDSTQEPIFIGHGNDFLEKQQHPLTAGLRELNNG